MYETDSDVFHFKTQMWIKSKWSWAKQNSFQWHMLQKKLHVHFWFLNLINIFVKCMMKIGFSTFTMSMEENDGGENQKWGDHFLSITISLITRVSTH